MEIAIFIMRCIDRRVIRLSGCACLCCCGAICAGSTRPRTPWCVNARRALCYRQAGEGFTPDQVLPLLSYTTLGRAESNTIVVADPYASAEHAVVAWRGGQWWLEDRDSRNGTLLNNLAIDEPLVIGQGDVIGIGHLQFRFEFAAESA